MGNRVLFLSVIALGLTACSDSDELVLEQPLPEKIDFNYHVKPILSDTCYLCHGPDKENAKAGLTLSNYADATHHVTDSGLAAIAPGDISDSEVFRRIMSDDENTIMPPPDSHLTLSNRDKAILKKWIEEGAEYKKHWAFIAPQKTSVPTLANDNFAQNEIDNFIANQMATEGVKPSQQADKESLIRRLSFDLTGLPPTLNEIDAYLSDNSEQATERVIDSLIASPRFGERMAVEWLDVARYADTHGYSTDFYRDMSPYRDWVIESFNKNRAFDEFVTWQVAGDLLPNPSQEQLIATAFNRVHAQNGEGGIVNEEFRVEYVKDRVQTIGTGLLGLTMHCAQCHDHKYDPISAKEYYATYAFFNSIDESGQISYDPNDMPVPTLLVADETQQKKLNKLDSEILQLQQNLAHFSKENTAFKAWMSNNIELDTADGSDALVAHFPFDAQDSNSVIHNHAKAEEIGKVMFGAQPKKTIGPDMQHIAQQGHSAIKLNGDDALYFPTLKGYHRAKPFSLTIQAKIPKGIEEGVLVHYNKAAILYNFKGFDVGIEDNHWIVRFAHTYPYNAIKLISKDPVLREQWQDIALSYDGASKADGIGFYIDGQAAEMRIERNNLYKEIEHSHEGVRKEMGLKIGARWRSRGLPGALVDNFKVYDRNLTPIEIANVHANSQQNFSKESLLALFNQTVNQDYQANLQRLHEVRKAHNLLAETVQEVMIMQELPEARQAYILERGSYASHGEPVEPGVPESVLPFNKNWPKDRRGLAKWLTSPDNPLVARVVVNRYWQMMLGNGLVRTPEDFGNQGQLPTHPELLDWLAIEFIESGWDVKHMIKLIASSATYQQSSKASAELLAMDPENTLYARGPNARLSAEMIRDNALAASGLMVDTIGGKSVKPYQPEGIWRMNNKTYKQDSGDALYRRSMYTIYKRSAPPPNMMAFDAPSRSYSVGTRQQTSTPLQALALLNDPQIVEASRVLAANVLEQTESTQQRLQTAYRKVTGRKASPQELQLIELMYQESLADFKQTPEQIELLMNVGEFESNDATPELAALSSVTNMLMNHDAAVIKR